MKKIIQASIVLLLLVACIPARVFAAGSVTVSTGSISLQVGGSGSFAITANNAAGRVNISSSNPGVASVSASSVWVENGSETITVVGNSAGSATITVSVSDAATFDGEELSNTYTIGVNVTAPAPPPSNPTQPSQPSQQPLISPVTDGKSGNANLDQLNVEGYELTQVDDTHFTLIVKNSVTKIKITAHAADEKATVSGYGEATLEVGENTYPIICQAENGATKTYYLVITRKDNQYTLARIDDALEDEEDEVSVTIDEKDVITKSTLEKIKTSKKEIHFVQTGEDKNIQYGWIVDGKNVKPSNDFKTKIDFKFDQKEEFDELVGYRQGVYLQFPKQNIPKGVKTEIYVGDQYKDGEKVSLYTYDSKGKKVKLKGKDLVVKNGMVEFTVDKEKYFITKASIGEEKKGFNPYIVVCIVEFIILCIFFIMVVSPRINFGFFKKEEEKEVI